MSLTWTTTNGVAFSLFLVVAAAAPGDEDADKDAAVADQQNGGGSPKEAAEQSTDNAAATAAVVAGANGADADATATAKSANASAVVLPSRGSKQTDSNAALSTAADDAALLAGLDDGSVQGNATAVVRLLREMKLQREEMQQGMMSLARATEAGFRTLTQRIQHLEGGAQGSDKPSSSSSSSRHAKRLLENGPSGGDEGGNEVLSDLEEDVTDTNRRRPASSLSAKGSSRGAKSLLKTAPASTSAGSSDRGNSSASNWKKAKTGAASVSTFRQFRRQQQQQQQQLYTPVGGGSEIPLRSSVNGSGPSSAGPTIQMVYRDASGAIAAAPVAAPATSMTAPLPLLDSSNAAAGATYGAQPPPSPVRFSYDNAPIGNLGASHNGPIGGSSSLPPPINASLNRDFVEVLDRGSLEDVARLLESSAAKPEVRVHCPRPVSDT